MKRAEQSGGQGVVVVHEAWSTQQQESHEANEEVQVFEGRTQRRLAGIVDCHNSHRQPRIGLQQLDVSFDEDTKVGAVLPWKHI